MKSKFSQILRLKKRNLDLAEARVAKSKNLLFSAEAALAAAKDELLGLSLPTKGDSSQLAMALASINSGRAQIAVMSEKVELAKKELAHFEHLYKQANLEFEKINYLHEAEIKAALLAAQKTEAAALDEFGTMGFARKMSL